MKNKTMNLIYAVWAILLGAGGGIWLYILMGKYYNSATNDFGASDAALTPFKLFLALSVILSAVIAVLIRKKTKNQIKTPNTVFFIAAALFAASGITSAVMILTKKPGASGIFAALTWLCIFAEFAVAVHFYLKSTKKAKKPICSACRCRFGRYFQSRLRTLTPISHIQISFVRCSRSHLRL